MILMTVYASNPPSLYWNCINENLITNFLNAGLGLSVINTDNCDELHISQTIGGNEF